MRAVRYEGAGGEPRIGRLEDDGVVDAGPAGALGFDASPQAWELVAAASGAPVPVADVTLLHPVVPRKIVAIGLNYRDHAAESQLAIPDVPVVFAKFPSALTGPGAPIVVPREETRASPAAWIASSSWPRARRWLVSVVHPPGAYPMCHWLIAASLTPRVAR